MSRRKQRTAEIARNPISAEDRILEAGAKLAALAFVLHEMSPCIVPSQRVYIGLSYLLDDIRIALELEDRPGGY
jgi:hypothetical protein